jgi:hypothetical protein
MQAKKQGRSLLRLARATGIDAPWRLAFSSRMYDMVAILFHIHAPYKARFSSVPLSLFSSSSFGVLIVDFTML